MTNPETPEKLLRGCTCHPDDSPPAPCAERYALADCKAATLLDRLHAVAELKKPETHQGFDVSIALETVEVMKGLCAEAADALSQPPASADDLRLDDRERFSVKESHFGQYLSLRLPAGCDMIVVYANPHGHKPVWMGLPHQLYLREARRLIAEHGGDHLTIVPYRNVDKFDVPQAALATEGHADV